MQNVTGGEVTCFSFCSEVGGKLAQDAADATLMLSFFLNTPPYVLTTTVFVVFLLSSFFWPDEYLMILHKTVQILPFFFERE